MGQMRHASPVALARTGGALYALIIILGLFEEVFVRGRIIVAENAATTAANLRSLEWLWRVGIASELVLLISAVVLNVIFFVLLRPVSRDLALLAVFLNLVSLAVEASAVLGLVGALFPLGSAPYLGAFEPEQLHALMRLAIRWHAHGFTVALVFFGTFCLMAGYLMFRSGYLPRLLGAGLVIAGLCYVANGFVLILAPSLASRLYPAILVPPFLGETAVALWLLVKGVDGNAFGDRLDELARSPTGVGPW
jgi:hypothetical protein